MLSFGAPQNDLLHHGLCPIVIEISSKDTQYPYLRKARRQNSFNYSVLQMDYPSRCDQANFLLNLYCERTPEGRQGVRCYLLGPHRMTTFTMGCPIVVEKSIKEAQGPNLPTGPNSFYVILSKAPKDSIWLFGIYEETYSFS